MTTGLPLCHNDLFQQLGEGEWWILTVCGENNPKKYKYISGQSKHTHEYISMKRNLHANNPIRMLKEKHNNIEHLSEQPVDPRVIDTKEV